MSSGTNPCGEGRNSELCPNLILTIDSNRSLAQRTKKVVETSLEILTLQEGQLRDSKGQTITVIRYCLPEILTFPFLEEQMQYVNRHAPSWANAVLLGEVSARPLHRHDPQYGNGLTLEVYEQALQYIQRRAELTF